MSTDIRNINVIFAISGLVMSLLGLLHTMVGRFVENRARAYFAALFVVLTFYESSIITRELIYKKIGPGWVTLSRVAFFAQGILAAIISVIITAFLLDQCGERPYRKNTLFRISVALFVVYAALMIINLFTGILYSFDDLNVYNRGKLFPVLIVPTIFIMVINLVILWMYRSKLSVWQKKAFFIYVTFPLITMIIQAFLFGIHLIALSTVIAAMFSLTYIIYDQTERFYMMENENDRLKMDILLAQIQPHFLFNSLTTIKNLCHSDPEKAEEGISQFTGFLRHNMDSLTMDKPIPFDDELSHVKAYVELQKLRFGDDLDVEYDIGIRDFRLPTLTLQPLVENAIIHGIRRNENGQGKVVIRTRKEEGFISVSVEDNGPGFSGNEPNDDTDRSHMGIRNVRQRLEIVSGAELKIDPAPAKGACVTMIIPLEEETC